MFWHILEVRGEIFQKIGSLFVRLKKPKFPSEINWPVSEGRIWSFDFFLYLRKMTFLSDILRAKGHWNQLIFHCTNILHHRHKYQMFDPIPHIQLNNLYLLQVYIWIQPHFWWQLQGEERQARFFSYFSEGNRGNRQMKEFKLDYRISSYSFLPWIVSAP